MDAPFIARIAASFLVAGLWIGLATLLAERLGTRIGGLIANLPSNILVSLAFIALGKGEGFAAETARAAPVGMAIDTVFLFAFIASAGLGPIPAIAISLATWALCATLVLWLPPFSLAGGIVLFALVAAACFFAAERLLRVRAVPKRDRPFDPAALALRSTFAGTVVASAVAASSFAPPYLTGIIATFPAVLLSTMTILTLAQGAPFARATGKILLLSSSNIVVYALVAQSLFPLLGILWATLLSFAAAATWVALLRPLLAKAA